MTRRPKATPTETLPVAASSGDRRRALVALRDVLALSVIDAEPAQRAALARQLRDTLAELDALPTGKEVSPSDDLASRRAARRADATGAAVSQ